MCKKATALVILITMCLSLFGCSFSNSGSFSYEISEEKTISSKNKGLSFHRTIDKNAIMVAQDGFLQLWFDENSYSVYVEDTAQNNKWYSLPSDLKSNSGAKAAIINLNVIDGEKIYKLNSQDDAVAKDKAEYKKTEDGVKVSYSMSPEDRSEIEYKVILEYSLKDGSLSAEVKHEKVSGEAKLESMELLPYMGATKAAGPDDYMILPDGCGAIVDTWDYSNEIKPMSFAVYGNDSTVEATKSEYSSIAGVFGSKEGNKAFGAVITNGDAVSSVRFNKALDKTEYNTIFASFTITPTLKSEGKRYISEFSYNGDIKVKYRFLSGNIADYSGVATACREILIREGVLSSALIGENESVDLNLSVTGGFEKDGKIEKATTFEQAQEILIRLKAKGVDNLSLTYKGMLSGGIDQNNIGYASLLKGLGGKDDLNALKEYMNLQGMDLYTEVQFLTAKVNQVLKWFYSAENILNKTASTKIENPFSVFSGTESYIRTLNSIDRLDKTVEALHNKDINVTGYAINDVGNLLYTDFSYPYSDRQSAANEIANQLESIRAENKVTVSTGNFYMLKTADNITEIPMTTQRETSDCYRNIPLMQIILHGTIPYSSTGINLSDNPEEMLLKCIEYGCEPTYEMYYSVEGAETEEEKALDKKYSFENNMSGAVDSYTKVNEALAGLSHDRITKHSSPQSGVYCTEFSSGAVIYVNTTEDDVEINHIEISANNFLRIN